MLTVQPVVDVKIINLHYFYAIKKLLCIYIKKKILMRNEKIFYVEFYVDRIKKIF